MSEIVRQKGLEEFRRLAVQKHENVLAIMEGDEPVLRPIMLALEGLEPISMHFDETGLNISVAGDTNKLVAFFRVLRSAGLEPNSRPKPNEPTYATYFTKGRTQVWFYFSSSVCKRVKVGTKMQEVAVYETRCEDITEIDMNPVIENTSTTLLTDDIPF